MLLDYHMHPRRPGSDGVEEIDHTVEAVERYAEAAAARGLDEIGLTEHVYYFEETRSIWTLPYQLDRCRFSLDAYCDAVLEGRRRGLPVKLGLEVDWVPDRADELAALLEPYPWDFLLASVHWIDGLPVDSEPGIWAAFPAAEVWERYAAELGAAARSGHFDVLAHPDLVKLFGGDVDFDWTLAVASMEDVCIEISSGALRQPAGELYPGRGLLALARSAGTPITLASDAHLADDVGRDLDVAVSHAREAGYDTVTVFEGRVPRQEPLG